MGCLTFLVSDAKREYLELGKIWLEENIVEELKRGADCAKIIGGYLESSADDVNSRMSAPEIAAAAEAAAEWMRDHPDWRFMGEYDDEYDDVYLAEDDEDGSEFRSEFGDDTPIYKKSGSVWPKGAKSDGEDEDEDEDDE